MEKLVYLWDTCDYLGENSATNGGLKNNLREW